MRWPTNNSPEFLEDPSKRRPVNRSWDRVSVGETTMPAATSVPERALSLELGEGERDL